jgi:ribosomal RNA-processing protein 9
MMKKRGRGGGAFNNSKRAKTLSSNNNYDNKNKQHFAFNKSDDEILSESSDEDSDNDDHVIDKGGDHDDFFLSDEPDDVNETAQEKRIRLAKSLLGKIQDEEDQGNEKDTNEAVAERLHTKALGLAGRLVRRVAETFQNKIQDKWSLNHKFYRGHNGSLTAVTFGKDDNTFWTSSKDCSIIRWNINGKKEKKYPGRKANRQEIKQKGGAKKSIPVGHYDEILTLAASDDGRFLVSGGRDRVLHIWDATTNEILDTFKGHRDIITSICFQKKSRTLFSGSFDRSIKIWNLDEMTFVDTLFGHQSYVLSLDCLRKERPISGGDDHTLHLWKIESDSQLIFRGHRRSMDAVVMLDEQNFISGSQDGAIAIWNINKKKPVYRLENAHTIHDSDNNGVDGSINSSKKILGTASTSLDASLPCWINCLSMFPASDLLASGSNDGYVRFWHANLSERSIKEVGKVKVPGFVNSLSFSPSGKYLVAAIGREHKLGKWSRLKDVRNGVMVIEIPNLGLKD